MVGTEGRGPARLEPPDPADQVVWGIARPAWACDVTGRLIKEHNGGVRISSRGGVNSERASSARNGASTVPGQASESEEGRLLHGAGVVHGRGALERPSR